MKSVTWPALLSSTVIRCVREARPASIGLPLDHLGVRLGQAVSDLFGIGGGLVVSDHGVLDYVPSYFVSFFSRASNRASAISTADCAIRSFSQIPPETKERPAAMDMAAVFALGEA